MHAQGTACWSLAGGFAARVSSSGAWQAVETSSPLGTGPCRPLADCGSLMLSACLPNTNFGETV